MALYVESLSSSIILSRYIHKACISVTVPFLVQLFIIWIYHIYLSNLYICICSSSAVMGSSVMNMCVNKYLSKHIYFFSFEYITKSEITKLQVHLMCYISARLSYKGLYTVQFHRYWMIVPVVVWIRMLFIGSYSWMFVPSLWNCFVKN